MEVREPFITEVMFFLLFESFIAVVLKWGSFCPLLEM